MPHVHSSPQANAETLPLDRLHNGREEGDEARIKQNFYFSRFSSKLTTVQIKLYFFNMTQMQHRMFNVVHINCMTRQDTHNARGERQHSVQALGREDQLAVQHGPLLRVGVQEEGGVSPVVIYHTFTSCAVVRLYLVLSARFFTIFMQCKI